MPEIDLIETLTVCLASALVCGYASFKLGLSPIVGYMFAGVLVGPYTPGFVANRHLAEQFADVGVILLMFGVGLQFHVEELLKVWRVAVPGAIVRSLGATVLGAVVGHAFGWSWPASLIFGLEISIASTVVLIRVLSDHHDLETPTGRIAVGWLVVEDLLTVLVLVLLPAAAGADAPGAGNLAVVIGLALVKMAAMIGIMMVVGDGLLPWLLDRAASTRSREIFTLAVLAIALGIAVSSARIFGISMALGAFLAGMVVGRSEFSLRAATDAMPMRDAFAVLFFVSIGILFQPSFLLRAPALVAAALAVILLAKPLITVGIVLLGGYPNRTAISVAAATANIGEFSFILAFASKGLGLVDDESTNTLVASGILSIALSPFLYRLVDPLSRLLDLARPAIRPVRIDRTRLDPADESPRHGREIVVVGYGPVGQALVHLMQSRGFAPVVIDSNLETFRGLAGLGIRAEYGDARHQQTLEQAGVAEAFALILSSFGSQGHAETIRIARELNPNIRIFARSNFLGEAKALHTSGADVVISAEGEVALAMVEALLHRLGEPSDRIEFERDRIRAELVTGSLHSELSPQVDGLSGSD